MKLSSFGGTRELLTWSCRDCDIYWIFWNHVFIVHERKVFICRSGKDSIIACFILSWLSWFWNWCRLLYIDNIL